MQDGEGIDREMRVATIREQERADYLEVLFLESARFYKLSKRHPSFDDILELLRLAIEEQQPVRVRLASMGSEVIENVYAP